MDSDLMDKIMVLYGEGTKHSQEVHGDDVIHDCTECVRIMHAMLDALGMTLDQFAAMTHMSGTLEDTRAILLKHRDMDPAAHPPAENPWGQKRSGD